MPLLTIAGPEAVRNIKTNPVANWPRRGGATNRVEPIARPHIRPGFRIDPADRIFTIGSCFARHVEDALMARGLDLPLRRMLAAEAEFQGLSNDILNVYGTPSIRNEIAWALDPASPFESEHNIQELSTGQFVDVHLSHHIRPAPLDTVLRRRRCLLAGYRQLPECRVVVITLGLAECWFDRASGLYLNTGPRRSQVRAAPDRYELHVLGYAEAHRHLAEAIDLIRRHGHPDVRIVLTVSPVPLGATHRPMDVMVANTYSKAVLRTVAEAIVLERDYVDYYPSYESVTLTDRAIAWREDQIHVASGLVEINVNRMIAAYCGTPEPARMSVVELTAHAEDVLLFEPAVFYDLVRGRPDVLAGSATVAAAFADRALQRNRPVEAEQAIRSLPADFDPARAALLSARLAHARGEAGAVSRLLAGHEARLANDSRYWATLAEAQAAAGEVAAAEATVARWQAHFGKSPDPLRTLGDIQVQAGRPEAAEASYRQALAIGDDQVRTIAAYAGLLVTLGRGAEARTLLTTAQPSNTAQSRMLRDVERRLERTTPGE